MTLIAANAANRASGQQGQEKKMRDVMIYQRWLGDCLMGLGLTQQQADDEAMREGRSAGAFGPGMGEAGGFETEEEYRSALTGGPEWLSDCSPGVLEGLEWREVEE